MGCGEQDGLIIPQAIDSFKGEKIQLKKISIIKSWGESQGEK